jgi:hypothetical protein
MGLQDYSVHRLSLDDIGAIQGLFEKWLDYMLLVDGHPADPNTVEEEFQSIPQPYPAYLLLQDFSG